MKRLFLSAISMLFLLLFNPLSAQYYLSGSVTNSENLPIADANIYLLRVADSAVVKTAFTEKDGKFEFYELKADELFIVVKHLEHQTMTSAPILLNENHPSIKLSAFQLAAREDTELETVQIVSKLPLIERKIDRTVVNVDAMLSVAGGTALDALEKSPGVYVDQNGNIQLRGKGVLVLIDDKPTYMSGSDLESYLRSIPASTLKQIEIMTNPPAKYDAAGNGGVINIKTKKNNIQGFNGSMTLNYGQGRYGKSYNSLNINYRRNKFNLFTNLSAGRRVTFQDLFIDRIYLAPDKSPQSYFGQRSYIKKSSSFGNAKVGIDYYVSDKTTFGLVLNGSFSPGDDHTDNISEVLDAMQVLGSSVVADNVQKVDFRNAGVNLNFRHNFDSTNRSLTFDADLLGYRSDEQHLFKNFVYTPANFLTYQDQLDGNLNSDIQILALKTDYTHPLSNGINLGAGLKTSFTKTDNAVEYIRTVGTVSEIDNSISNHFIYDEKIFAAYVNANKQWKRFGFQAGLRGEMTRSLGNQLGNALQPATEFLRTYNNLFPTTYLSYQVDSAGNHQLVLDYGKRIDRPYFQDLNPFLSPLDKFTFYSGNPYLKPSFAHTISISHTFKNIVTTSFSYGKSVDGINETLEIRNGIYYSRPGNIGRNDGYTASVNATIPIAKWYTLNVYGEAGHLRYLSKLYTQKLDVSGNYVFGRATNMFQFGKGWSGEFTAEYISNYVAAQVTTGDFGFFSSAVKKVVLKEKGSIKLSLSDMFYTRRFRGVINNLDQTNATYHSTVDSRVLAFTFSYRFGKSLGDQRRHEGNSAESEKNRVKG